MCVVDIEILLQKMILEFKIQPSIHMLTNYILPYMQNNIDKALPLFISCLVKEETYSNAIVMYFLSENKIREAVNFSKWK